MNARHCLFFSVFSVPLWFNSSAALDAETKKPYQLTVVLHVADHRLLTDVFRDRVERELHDGLQAALGDLAEVKVVREHPKLAEVLEKGLLARRLEASARRQDAFRADRLLRRRLRDCKPASTTA